MLAEMWKVVLARAGLGSGPRLRSPPSPLLNPDLTDVLQDEGLLIGLALHLHFSVDKQSP